MWRPFITARAIPKGYCVVRVFVKEGSKILKYCNGVQVKRVREQIEDMSCSWYDVSDNDDLFDIWYLNGLIDSTSNRKKFCFNGHVIHCMMNCFCNDVVPIVYM